MTVMTDWIDTMEDYGFDDLSTTTLARLLDDAHKELCLREPWPFREYAESITQAAGDNSVTTTKSLGQVLALVNTTTKTVMSPYRTDTQLKDFVYDLNQTGDPVYYYFVGEALYVYPTPSSATQLSIRYLQNPSTITNNTVDNDILWPARHDSIVLYAALSKAYYINDDPQGAAMQQVMEARLQTARGDLWMKQYDRPDRAVVLDDDWYLLP